MNILDLVVDVESDEKLSQMISNICDSEDDLFHNLNILYRFALQDLTEYSLSPYVSLTNFVCKKFFEDSILIFDIKKKLEEVSTMRLESFTDAAVGLYIKDIDSIILSLIYLQVAIENINKKERKVK